jgi:PhzF family phenazine biosynthesis protein
MSLPLFRARPFKQVDVFTAVPYLGNPVAVVLDGTDLSTELMQRIAQWTNLSETTFVLPPTQAGADYRVRIFTPGSELPFAGHPTIGTAHALLEAGRIQPRGGTLSQECAVGLIRLTVDTHLEGQRNIGFELPMARFTEMTPSQTGQLLGLFPEMQTGTSRSRLVDVGPRWIVVQVPDAQTVLSVRPDMGVISELSADARATGVVLFGAYGSHHDTQIEVRAFAPLCGIQEDPVCGSGNGCMAAFIRETGQTGRFGERFTASQGQVVGRAGFIQLGITPESIVVGGCAVTCIDGQINA